MANGGYVFSGGVVVVAGNGRSVETVRFSDGCAAGAETPRLDLSSHGVFRYSGRLSSSVKVILVGRFLDPGHAALRIQLEGAACSNKLLQVTGRLS